MRDDLRLRRRTLWGDTKSSNVDTVRVLTRILSIFAKKNITTTPRRIDDWITPGIDDWIMPGVDELLTPGVDETMNDTRRSLITIKAMGFIHLTNWDS